MREAATLRRLAIFWLICAATGFAAAAGVAFLLSMAIDRRLEWRRPVPVPMAGLLEHLRPHPHERLNAAARPGG
jgi:hypothetical protein